MRVNLSGLNIGVTKELLNGTDITAAFDQVRGERMAKRMRCCTLVNSTFFDGRLYRARQARGVRVMTPPALIVVYIGVFS